MAARRKTGDARHVVQLAIRLRWLSAIGQRFSRHDVRKWHFRLGLRARDLHRIVTGAATSIAATWRELPMRRIRIIHKTEYFYNQPVTFGTHLAMMRPREGHDVHIVRG